MAHTSVFLCFTNKMLPVGLVSDFLFNSTFAVSCNFMIYGVLPPAHTSSSDCSKQGLPGFAHQEVSFSWLSRSYMSQQCLASRKVSALALFGVPLWLPCCLALVYFFVRVFVTGFSWDLQLWASCLWVFLTIVCVFLYFCEDILPFFFLDSEILKSFPFGGWG